MDELTLKYVHSGHPSAEELIAAQRLKFPLDPSELVGDFWPEDESVDDFIAFYREGRGHKVTQSNYTEKAMQDPMERLSQKYLWSGHPSIQELAAAQGVTLPQNPKDFLGDFWPEDEPVDDFLTALYEWRGHNKSEPAA